MKLKVKSEKLKFFEQVYQVVRRIPQGKVVTYGQIAKVLGTPDARKVGWALHGNSDPEIPCHRVVNQAGRVALNYSFAGWKEQRRKLEQEGVSFRDETGVDLKKHLWQI